MESLCHIFAIKLLLYFCICQGAGDTLLDSKTPTMFVFGSLSTSCSLPDIEVCISFIEIFSVVRGPVPITVHTVQYIQ